MKLYMCRRVPLSIIRSLFTVHSAMVYVIQVCRQLSSSRTRMELQFHPGPARKLSTYVYDIDQKGISVVSQPTYSPDLRPCDFFLFPKLKFHPKVVILELWTTSKRSWQTSWGNFHMKTSSTATGSGSNVSGCVWLPKGTTLKGIMLIYR